MVERASLNSPVTAPNPTFRFEETSLIRRITEVVSTIFCNMWRTLFSKWGEAAPQSRATTGEIEELRRTRQLSPASVIAVSEKLATLHKNFQFVSNFMFRQTTSELPASEGKEFVMIPVVLEGLIEDHIVLVVFNSKNKQVEFYDPKGLTCSDYTNKVRGRDLTITDVVRKVATEYGAKTLWENTKRHQKDSHNCGVYVLHYIEQRSGGKSVQQITQHSLSYEDANGSKREEFMQLIKPTPLEDIY